MWMVPYLQFWIPENSISGITDLSLVRVCEEKLGKSNKKLQFEGDTYVEKCDDSTKEAARKTDMQNSFVVFFVVVKRKFNNMWSKLFSNTKLIYFFLIAKQN